MTKNISLQPLLSASGGTLEQQVAVFALLNLGVIESLANGLLSATEARKILFHAENCLFVRKYLREKIADEIMSHGVQLPDLFEVLPAEEAHRQFQRQLAIMRSLCLKLIEAKQMVA